MGIYIPGMARTATTADAFNAIAEGKRREILDLLAEGGERSVTDIVKSLGASQPQVSKHLRVLRTVDLVRVRGSGRHRLYRLEAGKLKRVHDWVRTYERFWSHQIDRIRTRAERKSNGTTEQSDQRHHEKGAT